jgi:hypothetical protein
MQQGFSARFVVPATCEHLQDAIASWKPQLALLDGNLPEDGPIAVVDLLRHSGVKVVSRAGMGNTGGFANASELAREQFSGLAREQFSSRVLLLKSSYKRCAGS